jgi:hypothetical protein
MANTPWQGPTPQATIGGLNSAMVYGENLQVAVGLNHQIALGSNVQICINPAAVVELLGSPATSTFGTMLGSGLGGNMQLTIGSSANVVWGRVFTINMGPAEFKVENDQRKPLSKLLCVVIGCTAALHAIVYAAIPTDLGRAIEVITFQVLMDVALALFMKEQMTTKALNTGLCDALKDLFTFPHAATASKLQFFEDMLQYATLLSLAALPPVLIAIEEAHYSGSTQDGASDTSSSSNSSSNSNSSSSSGGSGSGSK